MGGQMTESTSSGQDAKKKSGGCFKVVITGVVLISAISWGISQFTGSSDSSSSDSSITESAQPEESASAESAPVTAKIGELAVAGDLEFTVKTVECGIHRVGSSSFGAKAQGQFCKVTLTIKNNGDDKVSISDNDQILYDVDGKKYSADTGSGIYLDDSISFEDINPGNSLKGSILFDVPNGIKFDHIELSDGSLFGQSVDVDIK
jgi:hypothetical protein